MNALAFVPPAPPSPPRKVGERKGKVSGITIWTADHIERLREAYATGNTPSVSLAAVREAFPDWSEGSLQSAVRRYVSGPSGAEVRLGRPIDRDEIRRRFAAIPAEQLIAGVARLLTSYTWGGR